MSQFKKTLVAWVIFFAGATHTSFTDGILLWPALWAAGYILWCHYTKNWIEKILLYLYAAGVGYGLQWVTALLVVGLMEAVYDRVLTGHGMALAIFLLPASVAGVLGLVAKLIHLAFFVKTDSTTPQPAPMVLSSTEKALRKQDQYLSLIVVTCMVLLGVYLLSNYLS